MAETTATEPKDANAPPAQPVVHVAPGPHVNDRSVTTRRMMVDVLIALLPVTVAAVVVFRWYAVWQMVTCVGACVATEALLTWLRKRRVTVADGSAVVTGMILAFSLPGTTSPYVAVIASASAIAIGKWIFGGLGQNIFNPAMVGRAFVMVSFASALAAPAYVASEDGAMSWLGDLPAGQSDAITQATPMTRFKPEEGVRPQITSAWKLFLGDTNGSLGETSALALLIGGLFLVFRRTASWRIPVGAIAVVFVLGLLRSFDATTTTVSALLSGQLNVAAMTLDSRWTVLHELFGGAFLFGAFYIATDPVSTPVTKTGRWIFGLGFGALVMLLRTASSYPEGVMYAVLLMNMLSPLINRWTVPRPVGGPTPEPNKAAA